jgi:diguanylate cyclase (GGDEF)-like protein
MGVHAERSGADHGGSAGPPEPAHERGRDRGFLRGQNEILELIATGAPLPQILDRLMRLVEAGAPGMRCSVLLLDDQGHHLRHGAAPSLPAAYNRVTDGLEVGEGQGSCGTAAHRREQVIVSDIQSDPLWASYRAIAEQFELRACWSTPIFASGQRLVGTFAMYYREPRRPTADELRLIEVATNIASIAIERRHPDRERAGSEERYALLSELRASEERFATVFQSIPVSLLITRIDDARIVAANRHFAATLGFERDELIGRSVYELGLWADPSLRAEAVEAVERHGRAETIEALCRTRSGQLRPQLLSMCKIALEGCDCLLTAATDITERKHFEEALQRQVAHVRRYGHGGALIVLDLDHFKQINDLLGHAAGDQLLTRVAGSLRERVRESDLLARLGGDEFAVLLPHADERDAGEVATALLDAVRRSTVGNEERRVTGSIGVAMLSADAEEELSAEAVLARADLAMYDAKEAGRDRWVLYSTAPERTSRTQARLTWASRVEHALEHDRLTLLAQPILDLRTMTIEHHELLVRMLGAGDELIEPSEFLHVAERHGLIGRLDRWVSTRAIALLAAHPGLRLSVNISAACLGDQHLLETIERRLAATRIDASRLIFEVTETAAVANLAHAQAIATHLRELGCRLALDDFGAGFGSFFYLKHLPFDYVKIDGEFVQHAVTDPVDQLVIEAVVGIAQGLGKATIAEFVANAETQSMVQRLRVDYAQGHHVGPPVRVAQLLAATSGREPPPRR